MDSTARRPEPEVGMKEVFEAQSMSQAGECTVIFREHLPGRMYTFLNVLSMGECNNLISMLDFNKSEEEVQLQLIHSALSIHRFVIRTNIRRNFIDDHVARHVWHVVKSYLPSELPDGRKLAGIRNKMFYYRYGPGQYFKTHLDGGFRFTSTGETAEYTFIIYLNDDFEGGTTRFCGLPEWQSKPREVVPTQGSMLVFRQREMKHCGVILRKGFKHILQGMVMYGPLRHNKLGQPFGEAPQLFHVTTCDS